MVESVHRLPTGELVFVRSLDFGALARKVFSLDCFGFAVAFLISLLAVGVAGGSG